MDRKFESVFSRKVKAGRRRTYFFDVRKTKGDDYYLTITESTKKYEGQGYERHKIFLYKEDFNRFVKELSACVDHIKMELMPDYDYEEFDRKQEEWERNLAEGNLPERTPKTEDNPADPPKEETPDTTDTDKTPEDEGEDSMNW